MTEISATTNMRNQEPCRLLDLPAELRNMVYEYALSGYEIDWCMPMYKSTFVKYQGRFDSARHHRALAATCRQINLETKLLFTSLSTFSIEHSSLPVFCAQEAIDTEWVSKVQHVRLWYRLRGDAFDFLCAQNAHSDGYIQRLDLLKKLSGLKQLSVEFEAHVIQWFYKEPDKEDSGEEIEDEPDESTWRSQNKLLASMLREAEAVFVKGLPDVRVSVRTVTW